MNPGKSTTKSTAATSKKSKGFTDEEKAAMRNRAKELKADERAEKDKSAGESAAIEAIAAIRNCVATRPASR